MMVYIGCGFLWHLCLSWEGAWNTIHGLLENSKIVSAEPQMGNKTANKQRTLHWAFKCSCFAKDLHLPSFVKLELFNDKRYKCLFERTTSLKQTFQEALLKWKAILEGSWVALNRLRTQAPIVKCKIRLDELQRVPRTLFSCFNRT